jgi:hypothetical protein
VTAEPILVLAWLALAHLVADFVIHTETAATDKFRSGRRAWRGLFVHTVSVGVCLIPVGLAFGRQGVAFLVVVTALHGVIDRIKVVLTRRVEARAVSEAVRVHEPPAPPASLGTAWTPLPAALFALDQLAHGVVIAGAWAGLLSRVDVAPGFASAVTNVIGVWDPALVHRVVLTGVVLTALAIVNVRGGSLFVATLVHPREAVTGHEEPSLGYEPEAATAYTLRIGPLVARAEPAAVVAPIPSRVVSPDQVGAAIGVLERLLIVTFVLTGADAAVGFVVAAKTLARFRQLEDRQFAEYYLLGTLGSISVAIGSGLVAAAVLR